tara:strand:- start:565 stop:1284 length:720 start_codon:yes stop_codon:yes gene_type:complete
MSMKKSLQILLLSVALTGCASLELDTIASSEEETQKILSLGLTHAENLIEASKLEDSHSISVVTGQLKKAEDERIQSIIDEEKIAEYSDLIIVLDDNTRFIAPKVSIIKKIGVLDDEFDNQDFFLKGLKNNNGSVQHQLNVSIKYKWKKRRNYSHVNVCDKWQRCDAGEKIDLSLISANASGCSPSSCIYTEILDLNLSDDFLRKHIDSGILLSLYSKKEQSKIKINSPYIKAYLNAID